MARSGPREGQQPACRRVTIPINVDLGWCACYNEAVILDKRGNRLQRRDVED
jgi:hypothetical protein